MQRRCWHYQFGRWLRYLRCLRWGHCLRRLGQGIGHVELLSAVSALLLHIALAPFVVGAQVAVARLVAWHVARQLGERHFVHTAFEFDDYV